jgi:hypothetical protein
VGFVYHLAAFDLNVGGPFLVRRQALDLPLVRLANYAIVVLLYL